MKIAVLNTDGIQSTRQGKIRYYYAVADDYDFGGNSATDVTSVLDLKLFYDLLRFNYTELKDSLTTLYGTLTYDNLSDDEKKILCKNFIVEKAKRDVFFDDETQKDHALLMQELKKDSEIENHFKANVDNIINDMDTSVVSDLTNYKELFLPFDGTHNNVWHKVTIDEVSPSSVIMISVYCTKNTRWGGVREVGSALDRRRSIKVNSSFTLIVKVDANKQIEVFRQNDQITYNVIAQLS